MSHYPFDAGGYLKGGRVLVAPIGTDPEAVLSDVQWTEIGQDPLIGYDGASPAFTLPTRTSYSTSFSFKEIPPRTRREKRQRNAFMRMIWGGPLPTRTKPRRRQLIHNGRKP